MRDILAEMFERRVSRARLYEMILQQRDRIVELELALVGAQADMEQMEIQQARMGRDLVERFLLALEMIDEDDTAEQEIRDGLLLGLEDLRDHVARLEEHT